MRMHAVLVPVLGPAPPYISTYTPVNFRNLNYSTLKLDLSTSALPDYRYSNHFLLDRSSPVTVAGPVLVVGVVARVVMVVLARLITAGAPSLPGKVGCR